MFRAEQEVAEETARVYESCRETTEAERRSVEDARAPKADGKAAASAR